jgi:nitrite reductase (NADH) small subunit
MPDWASGKRATARPQPEWRDVCAIDDVLPGTALPVLVAGQQIAVVRTKRGLFSALSNFDPFSGAFVIARGVVSERDDVPNIASPIYEQRFSLETGECLQDPNVRLNVFPIRVRGGRIQIAVLDVGVAPHEKLAIRKGANHEK